MSVAMILSIRPRWPEKRLDGLDKMYRLHNWLGNSALVLAVAHWLAVNGVKWGVQWNLLTKPERGPRAPIENPIQAYLSEFRGLAESVGEWAFYGACILIIIALIKLVPHGLFRKIHKVFPIAYLALVFHTVVLTKFSYWMSPVGLVQAVLLIFGTYAAVLSLAGRIAYGRKVKATITDLRNFRGVKSLRITGEVASDWPGHMAGQFAFATSDPNEGPHPYTIASSWDEKTAQITLVAKAL